MSDSPWPEDSFPVAIPANSTYYSNYFDALHPREPVKELVDALMGLFLLASGALTWAFTNITWWCALLLVLMGVYFFASRRWRKLFWVCQRTLISKPHSINVFAQGMGASSMHRKFLHHWSERDEIRFTDKGVLINYSETSIFFQNQDLDDALRQCLQWQAQTLGAKTP